jgi:N4-gp56 family major capsid protein
MKNFVKTGSLVMLMLFVGLLIAGFVSCPESLTIGGLSMPLLAGVAMQYSDISPRTTAYADRRLLERAKVNNILGQFGQVRSLPRKASQTIIFRRFNRLAAATVPLTEGVTPTGKILTKTDVSCQIKQYGDWVGFTDVIEDTIEDPVLNEMTDILGEQAGDTWDILRAGVLKAGINVLYANGTTRATVNNVITRDTIRTAVRILKRQEAKPIKNIIKAGPNVGTMPVPDSFVAVCHVDCQPDFERCTGWVPIQSYPSLNGLMDGEAGSLGEVRVVFDNNLVPWPDAGTTASTNSTLSTSGTNSDVYPILIFAANAYGIVPLGGKNAVSTYVNNPKAITGDELAQRGSIGWKGWTGTVILQDLWMLRIETACKG